MQQRKRMPHLFLYQDFFISFLILKREKKSAARFLQLNDNARALLFFIFHSLQPARIESLHQTKEKSGRSVVPNDSSNTFTIYFNEIIFLKSSKVSISTFLLRPLNKETFYKTYSKFKEIKK